jgi:hypothetical protein
MSRRANFVVYKAIYISYGELLFVFRKFTKFELSIMQFRHAVFE